MDRPSISEVLVERDACTKYEPELLDVFFFQAKILVSQDISLPKSGHAKVTSTEIIFDLYH